MQVFARNRRNWILPVSAMPQSHWTHPHKHLRGSLENCSAESRKSHEGFAWEKTLSSSNASTRLLQFPHENLPLGPERETLFLFFVKKEKVVLFNKDRVWQQGHAYGKKKQCRDMPGGLAGLYNNSPCIEQFSLTELFGDVCSEQPHSIAESHKKAFCTYSWVY